MRRKGHNIVVYLDDNWLCGPNFEACKAALDDLVSLLRTLGFQINWKKIINPCQKLAFLGIMIDTVSGELSLKPDKLMDLTDLTKKFLGRKRASRRQLEQLAGKLCWAAHVVPWGTTHTRPIFTLLSSLKQADHKGLISGIKWDLTCWLSWLQNGQNRRRIWLPTACLNVYTDACPTAGGGFCQGDWMYMCWLFDSPSLHPHHINTKELAAVVMSALRWCHLWAGHHVIVHTDSTVTQGVINKGSARNSTCLHLLQLLGSLAVDYGFTISAEHIPGHNNVLADTISRLHEPGSLDRLCSMLHLPPPPPYFHPHMSLKSWLSLFHAPVISLCSS